MIEITEVYIQPLGQLYYCVPEVEYIRVGNVRVYADDIPSEDVNPRTVSGNVYIVPNSGCTNPTQVLHLEGDIVVDTVKNTIEGDAGIYCSNVGTHSDIFLTSANFFATSIK